MYLILFPFLFSAFIVYTLLAYLLTWTKIFDNHLLYRVWSFLFYKLFLVKFHIKNFCGLIPKQYILVSNHPSGIDSLYLPAKFSVFPLSKDDIKYWPLIGRIVKKAGVIMVNREDANSRKAALLKCMRSLKAGKNLLIFPEGGCIDKNIQPFHEGAFELSLKANVPILPVFIQYKDQETYLWGDIKPFPYLNRLLFHRGDRNAHLHIFEPFLPENYDNKEQYMKEVFEFYKSLEVKTYEY